MEGPIYTGAARQTRANEEIRATNASHTLRIQHRVNALINAAQEPIQVDRRLSTAYYHAYNGSGWLDGATAICTTGQIAMVTSNFRNAVSIYDTTDPRAPTFRSVVVDEALGGPRGVWTNGVKAVVSGYDTGTVTMLCIKNLGEPRITGTITSEHLAGAHGLVVIGSIAYFACTDAGSVCAINVGGSTPSLIGVLHDASLIGAAALAKQTALPQTANPGQRRHGQGHRLVVACGESRASGAIVVVNINVPSHPVVMGSVAAPSIEGAAGVVIHGHHALVVATYGDLLTVADIANPAKPQIKAIVADHAGRGGASSIVSYDHHVVVTSYHACTLTTINVHDPSRPVTVSSHQDEDILQGAAALGRMGPNGRHLLIACYTSANLITINMPSLLDDAQGSGAADRQAARGTLAGMQQPSRQTRGPAPLPSCPAVWGGRRLR